MISIPVQAQRNGLDFLNISPTPAGLGLSDAQTGTPKGVSSIYFNPALLRMEKRSSLDLSYTSWIADQDNVFGGIHLFGSTTSFAVSFYSSRTTNIEQRDIPGPSNGDFSVGYLSISAALARSFGALSLGISSQFLNEEVFNEKATGFAFNFGAAATMMQERLTIGASFLNLGEMQDLNTQSSTLPSTFRAGASFLALRLSSPGAVSFPITITGHADYILALEDLDSFISDEVDDEEEFYNFGATIGLGEIFELQGGYRTGKTERPLTFGIGILLENIHFNYALVSFESGFGTAHSVGIRYFF